jgi:hypothetical protein
VNFNGRKQVVNTHNPEVSYHRGPLYGGVWRARNFIFNKATQYPVVVLKGAGQIAGMFKIEQPPQLRTTLAATPTTLTAAGVSAGEYGSQYLDDPSEDGDDAFTS